MAHAMSSVRRARRHVGPVALLLTIALAPGCTNSDPLVRVDAALFTPAFHGDVGLESTTTTDVTKVGITSDLNLGDTDHVPYLRGELDLGPFNVSMSGFKTSQEGTGTVTADFGDITAGSTVDTSIDLMLLEGRAVWDFVDMDMVKLGIGLAAEWVDFQLDMDEQAFGLTESIDVSQVVPLVAAHGAFAIDLPHFPPVRLDLNAAGITLNYADLDGTMFDVDAMLRADFDHVGCFVGYRYVLIQSDGSVDDQAIDADVALSGWLAGLSVRF